MTHTVSWLSLLRPTKKANIVSDNLNLQFPLVVTKKLGVTLQSLK